MELSDLFSKMDSIMGNGDPVAANRNVTNEHRNSGNRQGQASRQRRGRGRAGGNPRSRSVHNRPQDQSPSTSYGQRIAGRTHLNPSHSPANNTRSDRQAFSHRNRTSSHSKPLNNDSASISGLQRNNRSGDKFYGSESNIVTSVATDNLYRSGNQSPNVPKPYYYKFGFKKIDQMIKEQDSDEIILYICKNADFFEILLKEKPRPDLLHLLIKLIVKTIDTKFKDSKLIVYSIICEKYFVDYLIIHVVGFLTEGNSKTIMNGYEFFKNLSLFFDDLINLLPNKAIESIDKILTTAMMVVNSLCPRFPEFTELFTAYEKLVGDLDLIKERWEETEKEQKRIKRTTHDAPPNDFRELSLYPTSQDLQERNFLRPNIIEGSYENVYHYLDIQFRLLREDFIDPLRMGIRHYKETLVSVENKKKRNFNIRIYKGVRFMGLYYDSKRPGELAYTVQMDKNFASKVRWEYSKRLLFNSLCLFSRDNFETFQLATVSDRDMNALKRGMFNVILVGENIYGNELCSKNFIMAESSAFFEPVYQTLNALINLPVDKLPMENYLLVKNIVPKRPSYLKNNPCVEIKKKYIDIDDDTSWLNCLNLGFNESQCQALKSAIRNEFVVIQGPPGTGKTYLGLNLVEILLKNFTFNAPILMVCYTNHALDQFLEGLLTVTKDIIRIGGQSKNEALNEFNYQNIRKKHRINRHPGIYDLKEEMTRCLNKIASSNKLMNNIQLSSGIINILEYKDILKDINHFENEADFLSWLLCDMYEPLNFILQNYKSSKDKKNEPLLPAAEEDLSENEDDVRRKNYFDAFIDSEELELLSQVKGDVNYCLTIEKLKLVMEGMQKYLFELNSGEASDEDKQYIINDLTLAQNIEMAICNRLRDPNIKPSRNFSDLLKRNLWALSENDRWALYHFWIREIHRSVSGEIAQLHEKYSNSLNAWREIKVMEDYSTLKDVKPKILGLTTNGAARHHALLSVLKPPVIVVEEAAEVLEAHILVSLTDSCQHLILIGDHKQLRPNPSTFKLAKDYHLDISLFERMLRNGVGCSTLNVQHRMKPNIASLIVPTIYPDLLNHHSVHNYPPVLGIPQNLYFIDHKVPEEKDNDMESHFNLHEAEFMIALCRHLLLQGYEPSDITILTTYSSQQFTLRDLKKKNNLLKNVRMTVVDNYQGEECKIILLSLVRSNDEGKIGFIGIENRICVALSRAQHGLYIIGNMDMLKSNSEIWLKINATFEKNNAIGESLPLVCEIHKEVTRVSCAKDFNKAMEGGCNLLCLRMMPCGHTCRALCHVLDIEHEKFKCAQDCTREICNEPGHTCPLRCYQKCEPCKILVNRTLPQCGHDALIQCHINPSEYKCKIVVKDFKPDCQHEVERHCFQDVTKVKCLTPCVIRLDCGHSCRLKCHVNDDPEHLKYQCLKDCTKSNANCKFQHSCQRRCWEECKQCVVKVKTTLDCGHTHQIECSVELSEFKCARDCNRIMSCSHKCRKKCYEKCGGCKEMVVKTIPDCGHPIKAECSKDVTGIMCRKACERKLPCGHPCKLKCCQSCSSYECKELVPSPVQPSCGHPGKVICSKSKEFTDPSNDLLLRYCNKPCGKTLPCKDLCKGTCGNCMQGRIHQVCQEKCGNVLICGHTCSVPCREDCPPCKNKCLYKCQHSQCGRLCGNPCTPCNEKCTWSCEHFKCTKRCGQECDREPCYEPCARMLPCRHPCVGFCGEPCPPLCRICNKEELTEVFFGTEEEDDARFVLLHDCKHILESEGLENWLNMNEDKGKDQVIGVKGCPKCKTPITGTLRFSNASKRAFQQVQAVKKKIFGNYEEIKDLYFSLVNDHLPKVELMIRDSPQFVQSCKDLDGIISMIIHSAEPYKYSRNHQVVIPKKYSKNELKLHTFICIYLTGLLECCLTLQLVNSDDFMVEDLMSKMENRFYLLIHHLAKRKYKISLIEIEQFNSELNRFVRIVEFCNILIDSFESKKMLYTRAQESAKNIIKKLFSIEPYNYDNSMMTDIQAFTKINAIFYQPVTKEEMKQLHNAMKKDFNSPLKQGHWFKCSNGHIYVITECGGAMEASKCPECNEVIGGTHHSLVSSSRLATEMDGSRHAAWSDQQNMANFRFD